MNDELKRAVDTLRKALMNDPDYFRSWQANIAMAFYDEYRRRPNADLHFVANEAAIQFLDLLIAPRNEEVV